jgi:hypothetical protein
MVIRGVEGMSECECRGTKEWMHLRVSLEELDEKQRQMLIEVIYTITGNHQDKMKFWGIKEGTCDCPVEGSQEDE